MPFLRSSAHPGLGGQQQDTRHIEVDKATEYLHFIDLIESPFLSFYF